MAQVNNMASKLELANHLIKALRLARKAQVDEKMYQEAQHHLLKQNIHKIEHIVQKYALNPEHAKKHLHPKFTDFIDTIHLYIIEENKLMENYLAITVELEREEFDELHYLEKVIDHWHNIAASGQSVITPNILHDLEKEYKEFEKLIHHILQRDYKDDKRIQHEKTPRVSFGTKLKSEKALEKQITKLEKRELKEQQKEQRIKNEIQRQFKQGSIELNFPYLFVKLLKEEGVIEKLAEKIRVDVKREMYELMKDRKKIVEHINPFLTIIAQYKEFVKEVDKEVHELIDKNNELIKKVYEYVSKDIRDLRALQGEDHKEESEMYNLIHILKHKSEEALGEH
jgi:hypothetical protein